LKTGDREGITIAVEKNYTVHSRINFQIGQWRILMGGQQLHRISFSKARSFLGIADQEHQAGGDA
jgi:hypothetical protein